MVHVLLLFLFFWLNNGFEGCTLNLFILSSQGILLPAGATAVCRSKMVRSISHHSLDTPVWNVFLTPRLAAFLPPEVFICGGYNGELILSDLWKINLQTFQWTKLPAVMPEPAYFHCAAVTPVSDWVRKEIYMEIDTNLICCSAATNHYFHNNQLICIVFQKIMMRWSSNILFCLTQSLKRQRYFTLYKQRKAASPHVVKAATREHLGALFEEITYFHDWSI